MSKDNEKMIIIKPEHLDIEKHGLTPGSLPNIPLSPMDIAPQDKDDKKIKK